MTNTPATGQLLSTLAMSLSRHAPKRRPAADYRPARTVRTPVTRRPVTRRSRHERRGSRVRGHRTPGRRPVLHAARDVDRLPAGRGESLRGARGAAAGPADHVDRLVLRYLAAASAELTEWDVPGTGRVARRPLLVLAHIQQPRALWHAGRRDFLNLYPPLAHG